ncbi:MAG: hypothetical protein LBH29_02500 [Elusimicrobiota bacterium]|jgi:hypothetical protein|nr:hypothetical protein [Elusimicrobiota bacterium]
MDCGFRRNDTRVFGNDTEGLCFDDADDVICGVLPTLLLGVGLPTLLLGGVLPTLFLGGVLRRQITLIIRLFLEH